MRYQLLFLTYLILSTGCNDAMLPVVKSDMTNMPEAHFEFRRQVNRKPGAPIRLTASDGTGLQIISLKGEVGNAVISRSNLASFLVKSCIIKAVRSWHFPTAEDGGTVIVNYPFVFTLRSTRNRQMAANKEGESPQEQMRHLARERREAARTVNDEILQPDIREYLEGKLAELMGMIAEKKYQAALQLYQGQQLDQAVELLRRAIAFNPVHVRATRLLAEIQLAPHIIMARTMMPKNNCSLFLSVICGTSNSW